MFSFVLVVCTIFCLTISVSAMEPRYSETTTISLNLSFTSEGAKCYCKIVGGTGTKSISDCTVTLTDSNGDEVKSWKNLSSTGSILYFSENASEATSSGTYTLAVTATVNRNGNSEPVSGSTSAVKK